LLRKKQKQKPLDYKSKHKTITVFLVAFNREKQAKDEAIRSQKYA